MEKIVCDGNEACSRASYLFTEVAGIYPITPSSPMPELIDKWAALGKKNIFNEVPKVIEMQSEAGAIGLVHGALQTGTLASTYTASQGLLLMLPNMYKIAGECFPFVMHVAARTIATHALSIFGDHQDIYSARDTGFCMLSSSSVQDAYFLALVSHLSSIASSLPFMHFFDGFRTSHELNKIDILKEEDIKKIIPYNKLYEFRNRALNPLKPITRGTNQNGDIYFQEVESRNLFYDKAINEVVYYMDRINELANTNYKPFNYYGSKNPKKVIIAMGSICETIKETIDYLKEDIGLITVHLYRPFSVKHLLKVLPKSVNKIAVLDRSKEAGSIGEPLYLDINSSLKDKNIYISHGRYGLSSKDVTPGMIKAIYDMLDNPIDEFTIGIKDDVTNLSLEYKNIKVNDSKEILIYGYGSDGMVSASKSLLNIVGENKYIQGYFEYDSKKSGGVTVSHLRLSNNPIRSSYFVHHPELIVISKDTYLSTFDAISSINKNGKIIAKDKYLLSLKDFCAKDYIKELIDIGVTSFKIEGRLKDETYVKNVVLFYRNLIDEICKNKASDGKIYSDFTPNINKTFNRGYTSYFLGKTEDITSIETPKSKGEYLGKINFSDKKFFTINFLNKTKINPQDGLCYLTEEGLKGFLVNKVEGNKIFPNVFQPNLKKGIEIFRNQDVEFENKVKNSKTKRLISAVFRINENEIILTDNKNKVSYKFENFEQAKDIEKMKKNIEKCFKKTGAGIFRAEEIIFESEKVPFMSLSALNEIRRNLFLELENLRLKNYKKPPKTKITPAKYTEKPTDYRLNIHNKKAFEFYKMSGIKPKEFSLEKTGEFKDREIMRCKHCIRRTLNLCLKNNPKEKGELFLLDEKNKKYSLVFDCKNCEMAIIAP